MTHLVIGQHQKAANFSAFQKAANFSAFHGGGRVVRWSWVNFQCRGVLLVWIRVGQGPIALAVGAGRGCLDIFTLIYPFSSLSSSLWETTRYRLKYCLKGSLSPKTTNQPTNQSAFHWSPRNNLVSIGQHFVITRVVLLPKRTETSLITESDRFGPIR